MPAKPSWLLKIPQIISMLEKLDVPVVDRATVERLFDLKRRQAIELLHRLGGYQTGRTFLVDRQVLLANLRGIVAGEEFQWESRRRERLDGSIDRLRRFQAAARVRIPVPSDVFERRVSDLPAGVVLAPGQLQITFGRTEELLSKLFELAQAAANDYERFCKATEPVDKRVP